MATVVFGLASLAAWQPDGSRFAQRVIDKETTLPQPQQSPDCNVEKTSIMARASDGSDIPATRQDPGVAPSSLPHRWCCCVATLSDKIVIVGHFGFIFFTQLQKKPRILHTSAMVLRKFELEAKLKDDNQLISTGVLRNDHPLETSKEFNQFLLDCRRGDLKRCQEAISSGININAKDNYDYTPLVLVSPS